MSKNGTTKPATYPSHDPFCPEAIGALPDAIANGGMHDDRGDERDNQKREESGKIHSNHFKHLL
jgi:hypothetical protein